MRPGATSSTRSSTDVAKVAVAATALNESGTCLQQAVCGQEFIQLRCRFRRHQVGAADGALVVPPLVTQRMQVASEIPK
jgi:hypothetical protein